MEDYEKFVEFSLSQLKRIKSDEKEERPKLSSLICFHGRPILPPLLSGPQREEMGRLREAAQRVAEHRKHKDDPRMSYVQTMLHSVHTRKAPTLEELLKESDVHAETSSRDTVNRSLSLNFFKQNVSHSLQPKEKDQETLHPFTSTTCSALLSCHLQSQTCYSENSHHFHQDGHSSSKVSSRSANCHPSLSSGYDSYMNVENTVNTTENHQVEDLISENGSHSNEDFFNHNSSDTVKKIPDIINYPPVDGEELERSGQESNLSTENPESISSIDDKSTEVSFDAFSEHKETSQLPSQSDCLQDAEMVCGPMDQPKSTPASEDCTTQIHTPGLEIIPSDEEDSKPPKEPYRMSLQALLKKSQEYRRRQRILRSQNKNAKIQDRAQDQPKSVEQSLSDKENDEWHSKGIQHKKSQERSDAPSPAHYQSSLKSYENDGKGEEISDKSNLKNDSNLQDTLIMLTSDSYDSINIHNWVNTSGLQNMPKWTENLNKSSGGSANASPTTFIDIRRKYHTIPAPNFCRSPVSFKVNRSAPSDKILQTEGVINKSIIKENRAEQSASSPLNVVESDVTSVLAKSSQHIDQLEVNLSGLKELISDLESTLTENVDKGNSQSESHLTQLSQNSFAGLLSSSMDGEYNQSLDSIISGHEKPSQMERTAEIINSQETQLVKTMTSGENCQMRLTNAQNSRRSSTAKCILSATQRMLIPDVFRNYLPEAATQNYVTASFDKSDHVVMSKFDADEVHDSRSTSLNQSYDVTAPSELWLQREREPQRCEKNELTPESSGEGQGMGSKVKRRLQMTEHGQEKDNKRGTSVSRLSSSSPKAAAPLHEGLNNVTERQEQLRQIHAAQFRALQEEHRRQQEQLLQVLAARYHVLHSVSLPYTMSTSRLWETVTFPTLSQPSPSPLPEHYRHLLLAAAKGFLTRRLLKTARVAQLVRTVRDTQQFLKAFQQQSPNKGLCSRQDLSLLERVTLQLRATRYEIYDIFFSLSAEERMQIISIDRDLTRERELKRQAGGQPKGKSSLSAATQKSLERKRGLIIQTKTAQRHGGVGARTRLKRGSSAEQPLETRAGQFRANPQRVPKSTYTSRPR